MLKRSPMEESKSILPWGLFVMSVFEQSLLLRITINYRLLQNRRYQG